MFSVEQIGSTTSVTQEQIYFQTCKQTRQMSDRGPSAVRLASASSMTHLYLRSCITNISIL